MKAWLNRSNTMSARSISWSMTFFQLAPGRQDPPVVPRIDVVALELRGGLLDTKRVYSSSVRIRHRHADRIGQNGGRNVSRSRHRFGFHCRRAGEISAFWLFAKKLATQSPIAPIVYSHSPDRTRGRDEPAFRQRSILEAWAGLCHVHEIFENRNTIHCGAAPPGPGSSRPGEHFARRQGVSTTLRMGHHHRTQIGKAQPGHLSGFVRVCPGYSKRQS